MSDLFAAVCSIAPTKRRRFAWAAWWSGPPTRDPFRKPDAHGGGAKTRAEALREAERVAGKSLVEIEGRWARAWAKVLIGEAPWEGRASNEVGNAPPRASSGRAADPVSIWSILGVTSRATTEEIKQAFRKRALETHPDRGGESSAFRAVHRAYEEALIRATRRKR